MKSSAKISSLISLELAGNARAREISMLRSLLSIVCLQILDEITERGRQILARLPGEHLLTIAGNLLLGRGLAHSICSELSGAQNGTTPLLDGVNALWELDSIGVRCRLTL